ncbi:hypothetical protein Tco_0984708 [Tanacetum coccineum]
MEDHLAKFHKMTNAKEMWEAFKSRFGGNDESKKMQKFQSLLSQLEIHGAGVSTEDANQKFLRSLPSAWSQVSLIMRTKPGVDNLSFDDLYNNLRVFESDVKGSTASSSSTQNVALVSENTSSTNDVSTAYDLEQLDEFDLEEMDLKWKVAMISMRMKKSKGNQDSRRRDAWNTGNKDKENGRRLGKQEDSKALVTLDGEALQNKGIVDSGCSRHMTRNKAYLAEYQDFNGGPVAFGGSKGYITSKGKIKTGKLDFEDVCFVKEL